ncbi:MAG TPA: MtrAB system histidine kinase MtrB [Phycicoccus sp.]|nr:MtrAB system histidine kinase MtrB [Phycicoccus sp.]
MPERVGPAAERARRLLRPLRRVVWGAVRPIRRIWRQSLRLRVVATTMLLGLVVVSFLGTYLYEQISTGLTEQKITSSQYDARSLTRVAQSRWDATAAKSVEDLNIAARDIMGALKPSDPDPSRYVIMTRGRTNTSQTVLATVASGVLGLSVVRSELRDAVAADASRQQTQVADVLLDGDLVPAVMVGSAIQASSAGTYDLYFIYPMQREQATLGFIQNAFLAAGVILTLLLGVVAWVVTRQVVTPVRRAAAVAERLAHGKLNERMPSHDEDDLALLATSFNAMADSLQSQIRQLEGLSRVQQRFVSDVSHELRTPLTTIRMAVDLIHESRAGFDPTVARSAELLAGELDRFESLLSDLLEISRFDAGAAARDVEPTDLVSIVRKVVAAAQPLADRRGSAMEVVASGPAEAEIDERRVERILRNLVVNAIEHGEGQPITVEVAAARGAVSVVVSDRGVGLRPGEASLVFNRFWRADPARARTTGGTGLGLAIALEDARLHNGWLQAWGRRGEGSRFRLTLPIRSDGPIVAAPLPLDPEGDE